MAWESTQFHIWPAVTAIIPLFRLRVSGDGGPPVCYLSLITQGLQELTRSSVDPRIGVYVLKKKTISVTCISSGTELTALFTVRCSELGSSAGKEVPVSFRDVLCLGYSAVRDGLTVGLQLTALLFDAHQYFSFRLLGPSGGTVETSLEAVCRAAVPLSSSFVVIPSPSTVATLCYGNIH